MVAWGSVGGADPLRCIIKRIVLTGYPFRVHKGKAVARHMYIFYKFIFSISVIHSKHRTMWNVFLLIDMWSILSCIWGSICNCLKGFGIQLIFAISSRWSSSRSMVCVDIYRSRLVRFSFQCFLLIQLILKYLSSIYFHFVSMFQILKDCDFSLQISGIRFYFCMNIE